jgi:hypothetical protein
LEGRGTNVERMMADGRISPAKRAMADVPSPLSAAGHMPLSKVLERQRIEELR